MILILSYINNIIFLKYTLAESDNFRMRRIIAWLNPEANADTDSYQFLQGLYAIGSGGFFGKGLGNSTQKLHARGPMGLEELCTYKYIIHGNG